MLFFIEHYLLWLFAIGYSDYCAKMMGLLNLLKLLVLIFDGWYFANTKFRGKRYFVPVKRYFVVWLDNCIVVINKTLSGEILSKSAYF